MPTDGPRRQTRDAEAPMMQWGTCAGKRRWPTALDHLSPLEGADAMGLRAAESSSCALIRAGGARPSAITGDGGVGPIERTGGGLHKRDAGWWQSRCPGARSRTSRKRRTLRWHVWQNCARLRSRPSRDMERLSLALDRGGHFCGRGSLPQRLRTRHGYLSSQTRSKRRLL